VTDTGCIRATMDEELGKIGLSLRAAAKIRPYFILALDGGPATAFGLGFIYTPRTKTCPWGPRPGRIFAGSATRRGSVNRP
jgi:hypothetical protein